MTRITLVSCLTLPALVVALISAAGCSSSNSPATSAGAGGNTGTVAKTGGAPSTAAVGGGVATGGNATAGGAATTGGAGPASTNPTGGTTSTSTVASAFTPLCTGLTVGGAAVAKGVACVAADTQLCYKTCGPENLGFKSETCTASTTSTTGFAYAEETGGPPCHFPPADYSCYKVPTTDGVGCPATAPKHGDTCTTDHCNVCGFSTGYLASSDTTGTSKAGLCVCASTTDSTGATVKKWSCASIPFAWPCGSNMSPGSTGC